MKEYEIKAHLPGQVEKFLQLLNEGNEAQIENSIEIIKSILQDEHFNQGLKNYKEQLESKVDILEQKTVESIKTDHRIDTLELLMKEINTTIEKVDKLNEDYLRTIQNYILIHIGSLGEHKETVEEENTVS